MPEVFVSVGSNVDREHNVRTAIRLLRGRLGRLRLSRVYESEAIGFEGDPFFNLVCGFETGLPVERLAGLLRDVEDRCGRRREAPRFGPRTIDLDLLLYGDAVMDAPLALPRPEILDCAFVLAPLAEIAGDVVHPTEGRPIAALWDRFDAADQRIRATRFDPAPRRLAGA